MHGAVLLPDCTAVDQAITSVREAMLRLSDRSAEATEAAQSLAVLHRAALYDASEAHAVPRDPAPADRALALLATLSPAVDIVASLDHGLTTVVPVAELPDPAEVPELAEVLTLRTDLQAERWTLHVHALALAAHHLRLDRDARRCALPEASVPAPVAPAGPGAWPEHQALRANIGAGLDHLQDIDTSLAGQQQALAELRALVYDAWLGSPSPTHDAEVQSLLDTVSLLAIQADTATIVVDARGRTSRLPAVDTRLVALDLDGLTTQPVVWQVTWVDTALDTIAITRAELQASATVLCSDRRLLGAPRP